MVKQVFGAPARGTSLSFGGAGLVIREAGKGAVLFQELAVRPDPSNPPVPVRLNRKAPMKVPAITAVLLSSLLTQAPSPLQPAAYTYQGTVQAVQPKTAAFDLVVGVGYALRVLHLRTSPATQFAARGVRLSLEDLEPGNIVRAECRMTPTGLVADRVEKVEPDSTHERMP